MKYLLVVSFIFLGLNASANVFDMHDTERGFWGWLTDSRHSHCALNGEELQDIEHIKLRGIKQRGHRGEAVHSTSTVAKAFMEVEFTHKYMDYGSLTCRGRHRLNNNKYILNLEREIRTSYRNIVATLKSTNWAEYTAISNNAALIDNRTDGQYIGLLLSVSSTHCELRAYTAYNSDLMHLRESSEKSSKNVRNYETSKALNGCIVQPDDVQEVVYQLSELVYRGPSDPEKDMPLVPKGPPSLKRHL